MDILETADSQTVHIKLPTLMLLCLINWPPALFCTCPRFLDVQQQHNTYATGQQLCDLYHAMTLPAKHREMSSVYVQSPVAVHASGTWLTTSLLRSELTPGIFHNAEKNWQNCSVLWLEHCHVNIICLLRWCWSIVTENTLTNCFGTVINIINMWNCVPRNYSSTKHSERD